jgi:hypothetical protein
VLVFSMTAVVLSVGLTDRSWARQEHAGHDHGEHAHSSPEHGGTITETDHYRFEVVLKRDGLRVYPHGEGLSPTDVAALKGRAYFLMPGAKAYSDPYPLRPLAPAAGQPADALGVDVDLSGVPTEGAKVTFQVWGLPEQAEPKAEFTVPFALSEPVEIRVAKATAADAIGVAAQGICPISGDDLTAMGGPIRVSRGEESLFLCCQGCLDPIKAEPDRYFASVISAAKATESDKEAVAAQGTCPISSQDLNAMGGPIKISRAGKSVFVCCPACIGAVKENADEHLGPASVAEHDGEHDHGG